MKNYKACLFAVLAGAAALVSSCAMPGPQDTSVIGRYQRAMVERGPQQRGDEGVDLLRPRDITNPSLQMVRDDETGKTRAMLSLSEAVLRTLSNNLDVRVVSYDPAIAREQMIQAAAEFDYVVFGGFDYQDTRNQTPTLRTTRNDQFLGQVPVPSRFAPTEDTARVVTAGVKQKTVTGARWELDWTMSRTFDESRRASRQRIFQNTAVLKLTQPLLRDAWPEFNLARLRLARINEKVSLAEFRRKVEQSVIDVTSTYWLLVQARRDWVIQKALLDRTIETGERLDKRREVDATEVEFKQALAAIETRRAGLIRAEKTVVDAQEQLVRLLADSELNLVADCEIIPTTRPDTEKVQYVVLDQLMTAMKHSPLMEQARLAIEAADISVKAAANQTLPRLDLTASAGLQGLGKTAGESSDNMTTADFPTLQMGAQFEYPIGNRERLAELRVQKLSRLKSITGMQSIADQLAMQVRERVREVDTAHQEMLAQRRAVEAARDQLDALDATEQLRKMSPEFLQVKLSAQETLSNAARSELRAIVDYNIAMANLAQVTGTILEMHQVDIAFPAVLGEGSWTPEAGEQASGDAPALPAAAPAAAKPAQ